MNTHQFVPTVVPLRHLYKVTEAMVLLSLGRSAIYEQMRAGRLRYVKQGRATLIPATAITVYIQTLITESEIRYDETA